MIKHLFKKSGIYLTGLVGGKILQVIAFVLFARSLGPAYFGQYIFFVTIVQLVTVFFDFGLIQWYQKKIHTEDAKDIISEMFQSRFLTLFISLLFVVPVLWISRSLSEDVLLLFIFVLIPEAFLSVFDGYYFARHDSFRVSIKIIIRMSFLIVGGFLLHWNMTAVNAIQLYSLSAYLAMILYIPWIKLRSFKLRSIDRLKQTLQESFAYATLILTSFTYARGDSLIVKYSLGNTALGFYGAGYRILESISLIPTALSHNLFPISTREGAITKKQVKQITLIMASIGVIVGFLLYIFSEYIVLILLGTVYKQVIPILRIFSIVAVLFFISSPLATAVQSSSLVKRFIPFGAGNTLLNISLNILFIPVFGITAAAWVMLVTETTGLFINIYFVQKLYLKTSVK